MWSKREIICGFQILKNMKFQLFSELYKFFSPFFELYTVATQK